MSGFSDDDGFGGGDFSDDGFGGGSDDGFGGGSDDGFGGGSDDGFGGGGGFSGGDDLSDDEDLLTAYENGYYTAMDDFEEKNFDAAIEQFQKVVKIEEENRDEVQDADEPYAFLSVVKIIGIKQQQNVENSVIVELFEKFLSFIPQRVTTTQFEDALYPLLDSLSNLPNIQNLYDLTMDALQKAKLENPRLRILLRVAKQLFVEKNYERLEQSIEELKAACQTKGGVLDDQKKAQLIEVLALEIQMLDSKGDESKFKELYIQADSIDTVAAGGVTAVIEIAGGKVALRERNYAKAFGCFSKAVKEFDEEGKQDQAESALKYRLLAYILDEENTIDPFAEARSKAYKDKPAIASISRALDAYKAYSIHQFQEALKEPSFSKDKFMNSFHSDLMNIIRVRIISKIAKCFSKVRLDYIAKELNISVKEVERLLVVSILDKPSIGTIDQVNSILNVNQAKSGSYFKYASINQWANQLNQAGTALFDSRNYS